MITALMAATGLLVGTPRAAEATMRTIEGFFMVPSPWGMPSSGATFDYVTLSVSDKCAYVFRAPKSGTISKVGFRTGTVGTGGTVDVRLETVSATDGNPHRHAQGHHHQRLAGDQRYR
jgi:hypothetical protein